MALGLSVWLMGTGAVATAADSILIRDGHLLLERDGVETVAAPQLSSVTDVHASYDASRVLLSARDSGTQHTQVFEIGADGLHLRQITNCQADCFEAAYLPEGRIAFTIRDAASSRIATMNADGSGQQAITFGPEPYRLLGVLPDGRLLVSDGKTLFGVRPDGTALDSIRCNHARQGHLRLTSSERVELTPQPRPRILWSTLKPELGVGHLISLDSRISSIETSGSSQAAAAHQVAVESLNGSGTVVELGCAPVEADGSFFVAVPADRPVRFRLLDRNGRVIRAEKTWIWARSGEERGCVGCHADKATAPQNHWPSTLKRFDTPTPLVGENHAK